MTAFTIREAGRDDAAAVVDLVHQFGREGGADAPRMTVAGLLEESFGAQRRFRTLIALDAGQVLGYAMFYPSYDSEHAARGVYLQDLFVVANARRRGVGRALIAAVARACKADGGRYMFWNTLEQNRAARAFYRRIGAREEPVVTLSLQPDSLARLADD